jgi:hypothetical protein
VKTKAFAAALAVVTAFTSLTTSAGPSAASPLDTFRTERGDTRPGGFTTPGGSRNSAGVVHDSDAQILVWVKRCNDAGGGMVTSPDGNYDCVAPDGTIITDY